MGAMTPEMRTIMIVDDDAAIRETLVDYLAGQHRFTSSLAETPDETDTVINTRDGRVRADAAQTRADMAMTRADGLRDAITALEAKLAKAEAVRDAARKRAHELANRMMILEAAAEQGREAMERLTELDGLLVDAERRLAESDTARRTALERIDAMDRAEIARRGRGRWARLRAAWRGE
jgi:CheY-like chemotaxis protein